MFRVFRGDPLNPGLTRVAALSILSGMAKAFSAWRLLVCLACVLGCSSRPQPTTLNNKIVRERMKAAQADAPAPTSPAGVQ